MYLLAMIKQHKAPESLSEAIVYFADRNVAFDFMVQMRWPAGVICPHCEAEKPMLLKTRLIWKCRTCRKQFSVKVGTIFEDSPLGLDKWLPALWMLANCRNGISSYELARNLGVTQKTAWFMLGRIRLAMKAKSFKKLSGTVEIDETFVTRADARYMADSISAENERAWDTAFASEAFAAMVAEARAEIAAGDTEPSPRNSF